MLVFGKPQVATPLVEVKYAKSKTSPHSSPAHRHGAKCSEVRYGSMRNHPGTVSLDLEEKNSSCFPSRAASAARWHIEKWRAFVIA
eukprot:6481501-Amphidinium_carterae.3